MAKIIGVEVSELFKPTTTNNAVSGYLEYEGQIYKVSSLEDVKLFTRRVEGDHIGNDDSNSPSEA